jgi:poly-gamma-glutamate synthesis protein (capsule biosynthesis protein)
MSLFIAGDFADPNNNVDYSIVNNLLSKNDVLLFNLEGPILQENERIPNNKNKYNLYSSPLFLDNFKDKNLVLSLSNNHINDFKQGVNKTCEFLESNHIPYLGVKNRNYLEIETTQSKFCVFSFNSKLTLPYSNKDINTITPESVEAIKKYKSKNPSVKLIVLAHFGLELSKYPMPLDREWSKSIIDAGADYVIGHHPHVIQGAEDYKHGKIFYSIGNFVLPQTYFLDKKLFYKDKRVNHGLIIEINKEDEVILHSIQINDIQDKIIYNGKLNYDKLKQIFDFFGDEDYISFYKKNNKVSKYYPIFKSYEGFVFKIKYNYVLLTQIFRKKLIQFGVYNPYKKDKKC